MPKITPSQPTHADEIPPAWVKVQESSLIFDQMCNEFIDEVIHRPIEPLLGSIQTRDAAVDELVVQLAKCARVYFLFAVDHAIGVSKCVKYPPTSHAAYACARTMIEALGTLHWLIETGNDVGTQDRFARQLELYSHDVWNERNWALRIRERLGKDEEEIKDWFEQRAQGAIAIANHLGIQHKRKDAEHRPIFATFVNATDRVGRCMENADLDYRLYSRVMHCENLAVAENCLVQPNVLNPREVTYAPELALRLIGSLATWVARATHALYAYEGRNFSEMDTRIRGYLARLHVNEER